MHHVGKDLPVDKVCAVELIVALESICTDAAKFHNLDRTPRASPQGLVGHEGDVAARVVDCYGMSYGMSYINQRVASELQPIGCTEATF